MESASAKQNHDYVLGEFTKLSPYVRLALYDTCVPGVILMPRYIYDFEFLYVKSGSARMTVDGENFIAQAGDLCILRPGIIHQFEVIGKENFVQPHVHFDLQYAPDRETIHIPFDNLNEPWDTEHVREDILGQLIPKIPTYLHLKSPLVLETMLLDVIRSVKNGDLFAPVNTYMSFYRLFYQVLQEITWSRVGFSSQVEINAQNIRLYLEHHTNRRIMLEELSQVFFLNQSYIVHLFSETYGITPIQYHLQLRIRQAKNMIIFTRHTFTEIAKLTGFSGIHDFSRTFHRIDGKNPSYYRKPGSFANPSTPIRMMPGLRFRNAHQKE